MEAPEKELSDATKISARSLPEVQLAINLLVARCRAAGRPQFQRGPLTKEVFVNAAVLYLESLPPDARLEAIEFGIGRLSAILRGEEGGERKAPSLGEGEPYGMKGERVKPDEGPPKKPGRKRRSSP